MASGSLIPVLAAALLAQEGQVVREGSYWKRTQRGTVTVSVTRGTRFERIGGFGGLHVGMSRIEATVRRSNGRWVASRVERSGGGGRHGGHGGHGGDDN